MVDYTYSMSADVSKFFEEAESLGMIQEHINEIDSFGLSYDRYIEVYEIAARRNEYLTFELRYKEALVGYAGFFLYYYPNHKTSLHAKQDILYINKDHRSKGLGKGLIEYCDKILSEVGVEFVIHSVPSSIDWSPLLDKMGYEKLETNYFKRLADGV